MKKPETRYRTQLLRALKKKFGGRWFVNHADPYDEVGIPDVFGCVGGYFVALEAKVGNNTTEAIQEKVLREIRDAGGIAMSTRSIPRTIERIEKALAKAKGCRVVYIEAEEELSGHGHRNRQNTYDISESSNQTQKRRRRLRPNRLPRHRRPRVEERD